MIHLLFFLFTAVNANSQPTTLHLHDRINPKFATIVTNSNGILVPKTCSLNNNKIAFRSTDTTSLSTPSNLGFTLGSNISGGGGTYGCQMQNGGPNGEFLFWVSPPLASDFSLYLNSTTSFTFTAYCTGSNLALGMFVLIWDAAKGALRSTTEEFYTSIRSGACSATATPTASSGAYDGTSAPLSISLKKGDRIVFAPFLLKNGGGAVGTSSSIRVDDAAGVGSSYVQFSTFIPFESVDNETVGIRRAILN